MEPRAEQRLSALGRMFSQRAMRRFISAFGEIRQLVALYLCICAVSANKDGNGMVPEIAEKRHISERRKRLRVDTVLALGD